MGNPLIVSSTFWVIPWKIVLAAVIGIVLLTVLISWLVRRRRGAHREMEEELEELKARTAQQDGVLTDAGATNRMEPQTGAQKNEKFVALNELFPSTGDSNIINLEDDETRRLIADLVAQHLDLSKAYMHEHKPDLAHRE